ncbi:MAG: amino acid-binding protein [Frankiaceae bacterium]
MSYLLRVVLPDKPGSLGALATALGKVGADIVSLDVIERGPAGAVDDILVELPVGGLADTLLTAAHGVPGVTVEALRPYQAGHDIHRDLELVDALAGEPALALEVLAEHAPEVFRAGWAVVVEQRTWDLSSHIVARSAGAPQLPFRTPWMPLSEPRRLAATGDWVPPRWKEVGMELIAAPLGGANLAVLIGRRGGPRFRDSELVRLAHLAGLTATVAVSSSLDSRVPLPL